MAPKRKRTKNRRRRSVRRRKYVPYGYQNPNRELKYKDTAIAQGNLTTSGEFISLGMVTGGSEVTQRVGNKICLKSIKINLAFYTLNNADVIKSTQILVMLVMDKFPNNVAYSTTVPPFLENMADTQSMLSMANRDRFRVLRRWQLLIDGTNGGKRIAQIKKFLRLGNTEMTFSSNTTTSEATVSTNNLFLFIMTSQDNTTILKRDGRARLRYTDS